MSIFKGTKDRIVLGVTAEIPIDNRKILKVPFRAVYKRMTVTEINDLQTRIEGGEESPADIVRQYLIEWRDLPSSDDNEVEFNDANLDEALEEPAYLMALYQGLISAQMGGKAVRQKN